MSSSSLSALDNYSTNYRAIRTIAMGVGFWPGYRLSCLKISRSTYRASPLSISRSIYRISPLSGQEASSHHSCSAETPPNMSALQSHKIFTVEHPEVRMPSPEPLRQRSCGNIREACSWSICTVVQEPLKLATASILRPLHARR